MDNLSEDIKKHIELLKELIGNNAQKEEIKKVQIKLNDMLKEYLNNKN